ncbi:RNA polymerase sigma factor [Robiginitalea sp. SC105]|uniref:RNA polymerase sigma factor n=1 Tax=Robiginitalea sp. SC105 TaxID=2762332 RepID=UPI001C8D64B3|nr:RNA polymerase sigma factor [Robiginitalea sp. SC105]
MTPDLIEQCRNQNRKAQLALYRKYAHGMFCVAMRFVKNEADAEDLTQEAFIRAFRKMDQYRGDVTFGAWLKRIVVNRCLDFLKAKRQHFVELEENRLQVADSGSWEVASSIGIEDVKAAIEELPENYRYVVQLYLVEGYDHSEISEILKIRENTSRTRLMRGKGYLKELLKEKQHVAGS